jgi:hypothetical protein
MPDVNAQNASSGSEVSISGRCQARSSKQHYPYLPNLACVNRQQPQRSPLCCLPNLQCIGTRVNSHGRCCVTLSYSQCCIWHAMPTNTDCLLVRPSCPQLPGLPPCSSDTLLRITGIQACASVAYISNNIPDNILV